MRRFLLVMTLAALGVIAPAGLAGAAPVSGLLDPTPTAQSGEVDPYVCIRSHILLGKDNPICIHIIPADSPQG